MKRSKLTILTLSMVLGLALVLPTAAFAGTMIPDSYKALDAKIADAYHAGLLTKAERNTLKAKKSRTDRLIASAERDGFIDGRERNEIEAATRDAVNTFEAYRRNAALRAAPAPAVVVAPVVKAPKVRVVKRAKPRAKVVVVLR